MKQHFLIIESVRTPSSGAKIRSRNIAKYLAKAGHEVTLLEVFPTNYKTDIEIEGVELIKIYSGDSIFETIVLPGKIRQAIQNIETDYIIIRKPIPSSYLPAICYKDVHPKTKLILDIDDIEWLYWKQEKPIISRYLKSYEEWLLRNRSDCFDFITVTCPAIKRYIINKYPINKYYLSFLIDLPNFLDLKIIKKIKNPKRFPIPILIYVASLGISSDLIPLLKIYENLKKENENLLLEIIGDGPKLELYKEYCLNHDARGVSFLGYLPYEETLKRIAQADVALNYGENKGVNLFRSPIKIREYLALGKKVVSNNFGDISLFKKYIFLASDLEDFKEKIKLALIKKAPKGGKNYVFKNYDGNKIIKQFIKSIK